MSDRTRDEEESQIAALFKQARHIEEERIPDFNTAWKRALGSAQLSELFEARQEYHVPDFKVDPIRSRESMFGDLAWRMAAVGALAVVVLALAVQVIRPSRPTNSFAKISWPLDVPSDHFLVAPVSLAPLEWSKTPDLSHIFKSLDMPSDILKRRI